MSGIAGILNLDGAPASRHAAGAMAASLAYRGADGQRTWAAGPVALGHAHFWTTPEAVGERQPLAAADGRYHVVADARLDNRDELLPALRRQALLTTGTPTDAEVILGSYICWGAACAERLVGDFAFAIWDAAEQTLFAARDVVGNRPLVYGQFGGSLYFASTVGAILAALPGPPALNEPLMIEFLRGPLQPWACQTVYEGLLRLPPAHSLVVRDGRLAGPHLYYVFGRTAPPSCRSDGDWLAAFRALLDEAIRCRLRSQTPLAMAVSGGLDSSAMACAAHEMALAAHGDAIPPVRLYSTVFEETPSADERDYFELVAARCRRFASLPIPADHLWAFREFGGEGGFPLDEPELAIMRSHRLATFRQTAAAGGRVHLSGDGGDFITGFNVYHDLQLLAALRGRDLLAEQKHYWGKRRALLRRTIGPLMPGFLWRRYRERRRHYQGPLLRHLPLGLTSCSLAAGYTEPALNTPVARHLHRLLRAPRFVALRTDNDRMAAYSGVEQRAPYLDRRLIEFALHLPLHLLSWRGRRRIILRDSMRGTLPEPIRTRRHKVHFGGLSQRGVRRESDKIEALLSDSRLERRGWLDVAVIREEVAAYRRDGYQIPAFGTPLCLEAWLRELE